jgi:zinc transport system ATP-binding protein
VTQPSGAVGATSAVLVTDVSAGYDEQPVLRSVSLRVATGEVVALLGANGSGKSTLVKTVVGLLPVRRGTIDLFGTPLPRFREWHRIGYVPQRTTAAAGVPATVREVVAAGRLSRRRWWEPGKADDAGAVSSAIDRVDLSLLAERTVSALSGGQQQRVLFARALAGGPDLLVLDEPTAGVDVGTQHVLADTLTQHVASGGSVLLVAHELGPLLPLIDRAVLMRQGQVDYDGPLTDEMAHALEADHVHPHGPHIGPDPWGLR